MPTPDKEWADMCDEYRKKQEAYTACLRGLYRDGRIVPQERLAECERLRVAMEEFRSQMDAFTKAQT
jgi:hypothetical protein